MKYTISDDGLELIKQHEGFRSAAYLCPAGVLTIGYGHTSDVHGGMNITQTEADDFLREDVRSAAACVSAAVRTPLNQHEADACISFVFNLGCGAFRSSTLLRLINDGDMEGAAGQFIRWNKATVDGVLQPLAGLTHRRAAEAEMFMRSA